MKQKVTRTRRSVARVCSTSPQDERDGAVADDGRGSCLCIHSSGSDLDFNGSCVHEIKQKQKSCQHRSVDGSESAAGRVAEAFVNLLSPGDQTGEDTPFPPGVDTPFPPGVDTPFPPGVDTPFPPGVAGDSGKLIICDSDSECLRESQNVQVIAEYNTFPSSSCPVMVLDDESSMPLKVPIIQQSDQIIIEDYIDTDALSSRQVRVHHNITYPHDNSHDGDIGIKTPLNVNNHRNTKMADHDSQAMRDKLLISRPQTSEPSGRQNCHAVFGMKAAGRSEDRVLGPSSRSIKHLSLSQAVDISTATVARKVHQSRLLSASVCHPDAVIVNPCASPGVHLEKKKPVHSARDVKGQKPYSWGEDSVVFEQRESPVVVSWLEMKQEYCCWVCGQMLASAREEMVKRHFCIVHPSYSPYRCEICSLVFARLCGHSKHLHCNRDILRFAKKRRAGRNMCQSCGKYFRSIELAQTHYQKIPGTVFNCDFCFRSYPTFCSLIKHRSKDHKK